MLLLSILQLVLAKKAAQLLLPTHDLSGGRGTDDTQLHISPFDMHGAVDGAAPRSRYPGRQERENEGQSTPRRCTHAAPDTIWRPAPSVRRPDATAGAAVARSLAPAAARPAGSLLVCQPT
jgi:hypothetical protein